MAILAILGLNAAPAQAASSNAELEARVAALEAELHALQQQLAQQREQLREAPPAPPPASAATTAAPPPAPPAALSPGALSDAERPALTWFGYGELGYTRPSENPEQARADLTRFVLGAGYRFDERTRLLSEIEIAHAVSSAGDPGEVELEQAYIEHELGGALRARAGLFLIPSGLLNENHEPTRYYGVFRNAVETAIIPSTWREGGASLQGESTNGLRWDAGVTTGFDLSKWNPASGDGAESPLGAIHQQLAMARAAQFSGFVAANYTGIDGLRAGASLFSGGASQGQAGLPGSRITLWEGHARWQPGVWDLAALYARGHISGTAAINAGFAPGATLVPEDFYGWYLQAAWRGRTGRSWPLTPFLRYERFNTGSAYASLGAAAAPAARADQSAYTAGVQLEFAPGVIVKADYVDFSGGSAGDRFDLGLGYEF